MTNAAVGTATVVIDGVLSVLPFDRCDIGGPRIHVTDNVSCWRIHHPLSLSFVSHEDAKNKKARGAPAKMPNKPHGVSFRVALADIS